MPEAGGATKPTGEVTAEKNVQVAYSGPSVRPRGARIRAKLDADGDMTVEIVASASYVGQTPTNGILERLATVTHEVVPSHDEATQLQRLLKKLLDAHVGTAHDLALEHAYEARAQARRTGEIA